MIRTFRVLANVSPGFTDPASLEKFRIYIPETTIPETDKEHVLRAEQAIAYKLAAIPNVSSVAFSTEIPMDGHDSNDPIFAQDRTYREGVFLFFCCFIFVFFVFFFFVVFLFV